MAESRLRKTFRYQADDTDDEPEALDEQEQEELIAKLTKQNEDSNDSFLRFLMIIPSVSWLAFVFTFIRASFASARLISLLSITSLWATVFNLIFIPTAPKGGNGREPPKFAELKARMKIPSASNALSPAQQWVPILNGALSLLIGLWGLTTRHGRGVVEGFWLMCWIPAIEYAMIQLARKWIIEVDPADLEKLKYDFRGA